MLRRNNVIENKSAETKTSKRISMIFLIGMAFLGFLAQFQWIGQIVITGFAIYALVRRVPVNRVFSIALLMLGMVVLAIVLGNWLIAQNFAAYSFLAFFYGIVIMTFELRRELRVK